MMYYYISVPGSKKYSEMATEILLIKGDKIKHEFDWLECVSLCSLYSVSRADIYLEYMQGQN